MAEIFEELKQLLPELKENIELKKYSTFQIGGLAKYFLIAKNETELKIAVQKALDLKINFKILGGGSNTLINSHGFDGLFIVYKNNPRPEDFMPIQLGEDYFIEAQADWPLFFLVNEAAEAGLSQMEWGVGIPGTVGGAINGNAGAFGVSLGDLVESVNVLEIKDGVVVEKVFTRDQCIFQYRNSVFKNNPNLIILSARIKLKRAKQEEVKKKIAEHLAHRQGKHPKGFSIGSIFKNYVGAIDLKEHPELKEFADKGAVPAGYLIEGCGLKGKTIGGAKISEEHANFIINEDNATSEDVLALIDLTEKEVEKKFKIKLEKEVKVI